MPTTIPTLTASRWIGFKGSGRTQPALIGCDLPDGGEIECVVKLGGHQESAPHQPVCELVASLLAVDLDLPVAEPLLVEITPEFAAGAVPVTDGNARQRCQRAVGWCFASKQLAAGFAVSPTRKSQPQAMLPSLAELYAFDALIQNADRTAMNPNCLVKGDELRFFDHDQAFSFLLALFGSGPLNQPETYSFLSQHFVRPLLSRNRELFSRLEGAWESVSSDVVHSYAGHIPDSWTGKQKYFPQIEVYLNKVRTELAPALDAVTLTLPA